MTYPWSSALRAGKVWILGFFLGVLRGTDDVSDCDFIELGESLRELNELINSKAFGESPRMLFRCSAAAFLSKLAVWSRICFNDSSSRGRICEI